jgi:hypothetical protein
MHDWKIKTKNGEVTLRYPKTIYDYTLRQLIDIQKFDLELLDPNSEIEELELYLMMGEKDGEPYTEEDFIMDSYGLNYSVALKILEQIKLLCPTVTQEELDSIPQETLVEEYLKRPRPKYIDEEFIITEFIFPEACKPDLENLQAEYEAFLDALQESGTSNTTDIIKKKDYERRLESLKEGKFILTPVKDALFQQYIHLFNLRKMLPSVPEEITKQMEENDQTFEEYAASLAYDNLKTPKEIFEAHRQKQAIKSYLQDYENKRYEAAADIVAHIAVPINMDYDYDAAEARKQYFLDLDVGTLHGILCFFLFIQSVSKSKNTPLSFKVPGTSFFQRNERNTGKPMVG